MNINSSIFPASPASQEFIKSDVAFEIITSIVQTIALTDEQVRSQSELILDIFSRVRTAGAITS